MSDHRTAVRETSQLFDGAVGETQPASLVSKHDYLIDPARFSSEGNWAFCRFDGDDVPALRLGFQRGGFNGGIRERDPSPAYLQLHLELMTREGAILWLPSGMYPADRVASDPHALDIRLDHDNRNIFSFRGWPAIECHFSSDDQDLQADLRFVLDAVTTLPDCLLPHCLFAMWESMGEVRGSVRYRGRSVAVQGKVFFDHTRVIPRRHTVIPRHMYVYSTLYFADGSGLFGYHSVDAYGCPIAGYCFHVYLDSAGRGEFLKDGALTRLLLDSDGIAKSWEISGSTQGGQLRVNVTARHTGIIRSWGAPGAPQTRREFSIIPLVLDGSAQIAGKNGTEALNAYGLAEYFNSDLWPADKAASPTRAGLSPLPGSL